MYAVLDRVTLADLLSDLLQGEKRMRVDPTRHDLSRGPRPPFCGTAVLSLTSACLDICACLRVCPRHGPAYSRDCYSRHSYWYAPALGNRMKTRLPLSSSFNRKGFTDHRDIHHPPMRGVALAGE